MTRVKYLKSTLREVVYQVRFPIILKLKEEAPSTFQERINARYPIYGIQKSETVIEFSSESQQKQNDNNHCFISQDGKTKINLTSSFLAISTLDYQRWEAFKRDIEEILSIFYSCYTIPGIQRIGLRYKNLITRSKLGLDEVPWSELIEPSVLGPLVKREDINRYMSEYEIKNKDRCFTIRHVELTNLPQSSEKSLLLDCDYYYTGFFKIVSVSDLSDDLHSLSQRFINESHSEVLLRAMQPQELESWPTT